ncbi:MAG: MFS transporter [Planctomycetota bacterium]|nr:MFS transporter [Planctomycetota bacterium]
MLFAFFVSTALVSLAGVMFETTFNNFLDARFGMEADERGRLEFPRELPGFLVSLLTGALFFVSEASLAVLAAALIAAGMAVLGLVESGQYAAMMIGMIVWSVGTHLMMPAQSALALGLSEPGLRATRLGQLSGVSMGAGIAGSLFVAAAMRWLKFDYGGIFFAGALAAAAGAAAYATVRVSGGTKPSRPKWVFRREYSLYYLLALLFGARKQIFITFGPWVLIKVFGKGPDTIASLWFAASVLGVVFRPFLGRAIDRWGERAVLTADALILFFVCLGYGFGRRLGDIGLYVVCACFVADHLLFAVEMARTTYLDKIAVDRGDVTQTLSLGVSINHAVSMMGPSFAGWLWVTLRYEWVFCAAAGICVAMLAASLRIPPRARCRAAHSPAGADAAGGTGGRIPWPE